ncbi:MAG: M48 family metallopeptidase, partial [Ignavibacteriae bacterium]|nr:M48 family metallopeptidase [Ignavibacteriota bacterium]
MNIYTIIILVALLAEYVLGLIADYLNIRTLGEPLPAEFESVYGSDAYKKSQSYTHTRTIFGIITSTFGLIAIIAFWFLHGFNWLDRILRSWGFGEIWTGLFYIGLLLLARSILFLPFSIYSTFVIEEKFGFNKTTSKTFVTDLIKGFLLAIALGGPLLAGILAFFAYAGSMAWLYCWIVAAVFTLVVQFVAPAWIMPLFNKFTPLEDGDLKRSILSYAESVKFSLQNVFVMDGSKRSSKSNAFFSGFGKNKRIALFDTLVQKHTVAELVAVLAHEIGHYKKKHIIQGLVTSILHMGILFFLLSIFLKEAELFHAFFMEHTSIYTGLIFFGMLYTPIEFVLSIVLHV